MATGFDQSSGGGTGGGSGYGSSRGRSYGYGSSSTTTNNSKPPTGEQWKKRIRKRRNTDSFVDYRNTARFDFRSSLEKFQLPSDTASTRSGGSYGSSSTGSSYNYGGSGGYGSIGSGNRASGYGSDSHAYSSKPPRLDRSLSYVNINSVKDKFDRPSRYSTYDRSYSSSGRAGYSSDTYDRSARASSAARDYSRAGSVSRDYNRAPSISREYRAPSVTRDYSRAPSVTKDYGTYDSSRRARTSDYNLTPFSNRSSRPVSQDLSTASKSYDRQSSKDSTQSSFNRQPSRESLLSKKSDANKSDSDSGESINVSDLDSDDKDPDLRYLTSQGTDPMGEEPNPRSKRKKKKVPTATLR